MAHPRTSFFLIVILSFCIHPSLAGNKPDFSGKWKLNIEKSDFGTLPAPDEVVMTIVHQDPELELDLHQVTMRGDLDAVFNLYTNGKKSNYQVNDADITSVMTWEGKTLKLSSDIYAQGMEIDYQDTWSISDNGSILRIERGMSSSMGETAQILIFEAVKSFASEDGFVPMFDGKTLAGWQTTGNWIVEEGGVVTLVPRPGEKGWQRYDAYLTTDREYQDFILDLEFKIEKTGNSGVFLRVGNPLSQVKSGMEVQILDTHGLENPGEHDCGGIIGTAAPAKNMAKPAGEWNRYIITCHGNRLKVVFNGEEVIDIDLSQSAVSDRPLEGYIGFQDEAKRVWYRNVRIKELK